MTLPELLCKLNEPTWFCTESAAILLRFDGQRWTADLEHCQVGLPKFAPGNEPQHDPWQFPGTINWREAPVCHGRTPDEVLVAFAARLSNCIIWHYHTYQQRGYCVRVRETVTA